MTNGIEEIYTATKAIGLYEPALDEKLWEHLVEPTNDQQFVVYKNFNEINYRFELDITVNRKHSLQFFGYDLMLPKPYPPVTHQINNGLSSADIEYRLKAIDWNKHPGTLHDHTGNKECEKVNAIFKDLRKFTGFDDDRESEKFYALTGIADNLIGKYLTGKPLAEAIMATIPYHRSTFYELYPFAPDVPAATAVDLTMKQKQQAIDASSKNTFMQR